MMETRDRRPPREPSAALEDLHGGAAREEATYCAFCGEDLDPTAIAVRRFGEPFCGEAHAAAFVKEARAVRAEAVALAEGRREVDDRVPQDAAGPTKPVSKGWDLKRVLKMGACCAAPILVLVFLAGGGGALLGAGTAILPVLAVLACPLGMFFMMRAMAGHGKSESDGGKPSTPKVGGKREE